jgi:probable HAF family extracellular repeat protein
MIRSRSIGRPLRALLSTALITASQAAAADKPLLIQLPDGTIPQATGAGGFTVAGDLFDSPNAFYWMPTVGMVSMGGLVATAVSDDGRTFVGNANDPRGIENAAIWQGGREWRLLGSLTPNARTCDSLLSSAFDASDDGKVIVGLAWDGCNIARAFRWEESTGMRDLGSTVAGRSSRANGVSGDGRVVVGWQEAPTGFRQGARWVNLSQQIIAGPRGFVGEANATNTDGSLIVGQGCDPLDPTVSRAWTWTASEGVKCYPYERRFNPQRIFFQTLMLSTSDDGRVIGGASSFGLESESLLWIDGEPHLLKDYLRENGTPDAFQGWINTGFITAVSRDGRVLTGYGAGPRTFTGFVVILPPLPPRAGSEGR